MEEVFHHYSQKSTKEDDLLEMVHEFLDAEMKWQFTVVDKNRTML